MKNVVRILLCVTLILTVLSTQLIPLHVYAEENSVTISYENREEVEQKILDFIDENKEATPAVSITVFDSNQDICNIVYGEANISENLAADENTVYEWGSLTKMLVWTSAMQLYEQGKLDLNEDIKTYLPEGFLKNISFKKSITMLDLMNHSAGFQEMLKSPETDDINAIMPLGEALSETAPAQTYEPGETLSYSNWSAALAGYIIECISGVDFADYVNKNIFEPIGMEHSYIRPDVSDNEWAAEMRKKTHCYFYSGEGLEDLGECRRYIHLYPAGSAGGTIADLAAFAKAFLCESKDCPLFEKEDTLDIMLSPSLYFSDGTTPRMCHGIFFADYGSGLYGHGGNTEGFSSQLELDLENKTGIVLMTNKQGDSIYTDKLIETLYGSYSMPTDDDSGFEKIDLSGHYKMGRSTYGAGALKILGFFRDDLELRENGDSYALIQGDFQVGTVEQISDNGAIMELITGSKNYIFLKTDSKGNIAALESFHAIDYRKVSDSKYSAEYVSIIILIASAAVMIVLFVIHIIRLRKFKNDYLYRFKLIEMLAGLAVLVMTIDMAIAVILFSVFAVQGIILSVLAAAEVVLIVMCWLCKSKPERKIILIIESVCTLIMIAGILYWNLYQFWGF